MVPGPGSNLADHTLLEVTASGDLIIAGGAGNGHRLAELTTANNPSGWAGVLKVKTPSGTTLGCILLAFEISRIKAAIETWAQYGTTSDRRRLAGVY